MNSKRKVAYFSMEIGVDPDMPTYSGGLGVLSGDTVKAAADLRVPMVAVTLLHRKGYCRQILDDHGSQREEPVDWPIQDFVRPTTAQITVTVEGKPVHIRCWTRDTIGATGHRIPVLFLDTDLPENADEHRGLTHHLYGGDHRYRLCQEQILGVGGLRALRALGHNTLTRFHMNEGHAALMACELLDEATKERNAKKINADDVESVRRKCVFTTHTPVPAGHDVFPVDLAEHVLPEHTCELLRHLECLDGSLNMTHLALKLSHYVNGVARKHAEISREMFAPIPVDAITNGVHARTWISSHLQDVLDEYVPAWREDSYDLRNAAAIPGYKIWQAHDSAKKEFFKEVGRLTNVRMDEDVFTIGFARRAAGYKRADLFFHDLDTLRRIHRDVGKFQVVYAGKAHPSDDGGKDMIRRIFGAKAELAQQINIAYLPDYDMHLGRLMTAGVDVWLNTPEPPMEASGTSGMKAAMNGVPSLSTLDGWWLEGWIENTTGWSIGQMGPNGPEKADRARDAETLYHKLEYIILPLFYNERERFIEIMRNCITLNGSFFNTQRMMHQYVLKAYYT